MLNDIKTSNRNLLLMTMEGAFFFFGIAFLGENTVVPIFIDTFTNNVEYLGLAVTLIMVAKLLPKLLLGPYMAKIKDMSRFLKITMLIHRPLPILMIPVLLLVKDPLIIFWTFLFMYCLLWGINGLTAVAWADVFARTIPGNKRGQLQGNQLFLGGIASLLSGYLIKVILDNDGLTNNIKYLIIFGIGGVVLLISAMVILPVKDQPRKVKDEKINLLTYFKALPKYLNKNSRYKAMVIIQVISKFGDLIIPFIVVICKNRLGYSATNVSTLVIYQVAGTMIGGFLWGTISRRFGNKNVILTCEITGLILSLATLFSIIINPYISTFPIMCIVMIMAGAKTGSWLGYSNYMLDVVGEENRIDYLTLNTIILFPLSFGSYFAGILNKNFGFMPLIIFSIFIGIICTWKAISLGCVKELMVKTD